MPALSVVIITLNEADNIRECLESVRWADEIIVLDSGSTDDTLKICREYTDKIHVNADWQGFGTQKNRALSHATGDWVLSLDADERVTGNLRAEIQATIHASGKANAFEIPRLSVFCGREIRHGDWWPDYVVRLFRRSAARFSDDIVHERLLFEGQFGRLENPLTHLAYHSLGQLLEKLNRYTSAGARAMHQKGRRGGLGRGLAHGLWSFLRAYLLRRGFLDGREGFILALAGAQSSYYRYLKLMYLEKSHGRDVEET
jgi:glycosyltransferase involved in cell wall biosynthesis